MKKLREFLAEKIVNISNKDVDLLYAPLKPHIEAFQKVIKTIQVQKLSDNKASSLFSDQVSNYKGILKTITSDQLTSKETKAAHLIKPIRIEIHYATQSSFYNPSHNLMIIGLSKNALQAMEHLWGIPETQRKQLYSEFTEIRVKSTIYHELAHWMDDALHNLHLTKASEKGPEVFHQHILSGQKDVYMGPIEIEAMVTQIALMKKKMGVAKYNKLTWEDLLDLQATLRTLDTVLGQAWRRKMFERMSRENLLTDKIRK